MSTVPIPSQLPQDLKENSGRFDEVMTSDAHYYVDRFGVKRWTIAGFQFTAEEAIRNYGYITMDSFEDGATLTLPNQVLRYEATGEYYRWDGAFPKDVAPGSTPATTGGVGFGAWVSVGDASLRSDLNSISGASIVKTTSGESTQNVLDKASDLYAEYFGDLTAPDATTAMQAAINYAANEKRELKVRTSSINISQLVLPDNVILNLGACTLKQIPGTNKPLLRNAVFSYTDKNYTNNNITIIDGILDFDGANQSDTSSSGEINVGCAFFGVDGLNLRGRTVFKNARRYNVFIANCANIFIDNPEIYNDPAITSHNKDGIHFCGKVYGVHINSLFVFNPNDDALALNADDIEHGGEWTRANITGPIENVYVGMVRVDGPSSHNGVRMLSASANTPITNVSIGDIVGKVDNYFLNIESYGLGESCVYQNVKVGNVGGVFEVRSNASFTYGMVNINTMKPSVYTVSNIRIDNIYRDQAIGDGQDRPTVTLGIERTAISIGRITERNCANDATVRISEVGAVSAVSIEAGIKTSTRTLTPGIYGAFVHAINSNANRLEWLDVGYVSADHLRHIVLASYITIKYLKVFHDGSADTGPVYLSSAKVITLSWESSVPSTYQFSSQRYTLTGDSMVEFERPAVTGGSTAERPINAIIGDSFYDTTTNTRVNWNGFDWV